MAHVVVAARAARLRSRRRRSRGRAGQTGVLGLSSSQREAQTGAAAVLLQVAVWVVVASVALRVAGVKFAQVAWLPPGIVAFVAFAGRETTPGGGLSGEVPLSPSWAEQLTPR